MRPPALLPVAIAVSVAQAAALGSHDPLATYLTNELRVSPDEMAALAGGEVLVRLPTTNESREIAAVGVVHIAAPASAFVEAVLDVENTRRRFNASQVGRFSDPPRLEDLAGLTLDDGDLASLRQCRVGACDVKLPASAIEHFRTAIPWSARDAHARANLAFRQTLLDLVSAYVRSGNDALIEYADKPQRVSLGDEVRALIRAPSYVARHAPALIDALGQPPSAPRSTATDVIYWAKEARAGSKPVVSVTHTHVHWPPAGDAHAAFIASKQLYASHYLEGSLALTAVVPSRAPGQSGIDVIYVNRARVDALRGGWMGIRRSVANRRVRRTLETGLLQMKRRLEASGTGRRGGPAGS